MSSLFFYIVVICFSLSFFLLYRYAGETPSSILLAHRSFYKTPVEFLVALVPVIFLTGVRYGIGADYFSYASIYKLLHFTPLPVYLKKHFEGVGAYYTEIGWYVLNRFFSFDYCSLLFVVETVIFCFLYKGLSFFKEHINVPFALMIYCFTQLLYSWNGIRFAIAVVVLFSGFEYIICRKPVKWILTVLLAMMFHKTAVICLPFYFLAEFSSARLNALRNLLLYLFVFLFPLLIKTIILIAGFIPLFSRYLSAAIYVIGDFHFSPMFLFHVVPVIVPLLFVRGKFIQRDSIARVLFRIYLLEIPFREAGMVSTYLSRLARFPQMVGVIFIPYVLMSLPKGWRKTYLYVYYFCWYLFYFFYYAVINDQGSSYPYQTILFM